ncbi:hypothetical protein MD484_g8502, partial [Candolleomyces efflorescens]
MVTTPRKRQARKQGIQPPATPTCKKAKQKPPPATPTRKRNPQRCRRCPGLPLRSECVHGYRRTVPENEPSVANAPAQVTTAPSEHEPGPSPFTYGQLHALAVAQGLIPGPTTSGPFLPAGGLVGGFINATPQPQGQNPSFPLDPVLASIPPASSGQPTPFAQPPRHRTPSPTPDPASPTNDAPNSPFEGESDDPFTSPPSTPTAARKRVYASNSNAIHGFIEGVGRGNGLLDMARVRPMKPVATSRKSATRKFNRFARDMFTRAEDISNGTACWMYVAMHQPGSGHPFLHFASRRLRSEAPEELQKIHQQVGTTMSMLKRADRARLLDHERVRMEAEKSAAVALARADKAELEVERLRQELEARDKVLSSLGRTDSD